ncbi:hypothetical protein GCM10009104_27970 [Marinobacterium maritimum]|uniref:CYTH domain-containing protein n=1 Tax=Marinobacterium maritimum TaxID=500162 RepID=A0ABN1I8Y4_9GAMM
MATETELKLQLQAADLDAFRMHPLLQTGIAGGTGTLLNTYYDSVDLSLATAKVALRLRRQGARIIQTLKTRGQSINGLHQRGEWEWDLPQAVLNPELLHDEIWPTSLPPAAELQLVPVFTTDFEREIWQIRYQSAEVEVALDQGQIRCDCPQGGSLQDEILEVELELKSGDASALLALADELGRSIALQPFDLSKAQRGYQLFQQCQQREQ